MAVILEITTEQQIDGFEIALIDLVDKFRLQFKAQLPPEIIAHILRGTYDKLSTDKVNWDEVLSGT